MDKKHKISWMALRYENERSNLELQLGVTVLLSLITIGTLVYHNYLLAVVIAFSCSAIWYLKKHESEYIPIAIDHNGIAINNAFIHYDKIAAFYIDDYDDGAYLLFRLKNTLINPTQVIIIESEVPIEALRTLLLKHLPEKKLKQSSSDKLINAF